MKKILEEDLGFGKIEFYENIAVGEMKAGITSDAKEIGEIISCCLDFYKDRPFGYLSKRVHSYSVNPVHYLQLKNIDNFKAFAILSSSPIGKTNAAIEQHFCDKPLKLFQEEEDAFAWIKSYL